MSLGDHPLVAQGAVGRSRPVPFRQEIPFEDAILQRPFSGDAVDAARAAMDQPVERPRAA